MNHINALAINGGHPVRDTLIPIHIPYLDQSDSKAVLDAVRSTFVSGDGPSCKEFEKILGKFLGIRYVFFTTSCTAALDLAFRIKKFPTGAEVIVPNFTYTSTALGPLLNNLEIRLVDVDPYTGNIDVSKIEKVLSDKTVAICPVDYAGNPADMDLINEIASEYGLYVVHDVAQSIGANFLGKYTGTHSDVATFSFHGTKNMTTGEGGAIVTDNEFLAEQIKIMREKGTNKYYFTSGNKTKGYYEYIDTGNSYVQSNILGALGISQLNKLEYMNNRRKEIADYYLNELSDLNQIRLPETRKGCERNWHLFPVLVPQERKDWIIEALISEGIGCNIHYNPLHRNAYYKHLGSDRDFPGSVKFYNRLIRIPIYPSLSDADIEDIVMAIRKVMTSMP